MNKLGLLVLLNLFLANLKETLKISPESNRTILYCVKIQFVKLSNRKLSLRELNYLLVQNFTKIEKFNLF